MDMVSPFGPHPPFEEEEKIIIEAALENIVTSIYVCVIHSGN